MTTLCSFHPSEDAIAVLAAEQAAQQRRVLMRLAAIAGELAEAVLQGVMEGESPIVAAQAFDTLSRSARRCIMLIERLDMPVRQRVQAQAEREAAARAVIRRVEDTIQADGSDEAAEGLERELQERLDGPEFGRELMTRPVDELIEEICHDLGLSDPADGRLWKRREPAVVRALWNRAVQAARHVAAPAEAMLEGDDPAAGYLRPARE